MNALSASLKSFVKYLLWTAIAAAGFAAADKIGDVVPVIYVSLAAAVLKSVATFAQTKANESEGK